MEDTRHIMGATLLTRWTIVAGLMIFASIVHATPGHKLLNHCKSGEGTGLESAIPFGTCLGFTSAVMEAMIANGRDERFKTRTASDPPLKQGYMSGYRACFPAETNPGDVRNAAKQFLSENPKKLKGRAVDLVAEALAASYPCK